MKKTVIAIISALLIAIIAISFVGCMKVTMTEKSILSRLEKEEYVVMSGHSMKKTIYAYKMDMTVHEEYGEIPSAVWEVAIYFMGDTESADKLEESFKELAKQYQDAYDEMMALIEKGEMETVTQFPKRYMVYRYDNIVVFGDWESVSLVRSY